MRSFYRERGFAPLWVGDNGALPRAKAVATFLGGVAVDGLDPAQYPVPRFAGTSPEELAADELKLTNSVLTFARHARTGRLDYNRVSSAAYFELQFPEASDVLRKLAAAPDAGSVLNGFHPQQPGYKALKAELARQRNRAAGIQDPDAVRIPAGQKLRPGMKDERVPLLRKRFKQPATASTVYDPELVEAVKDFQDRSGVDADGIVGVSTVQRLNNELEVRTNRIDTIIANMERWRWMPRDLGTTYVMVNIPDYTLKVVQRRQDWSWTTRIVVGKPGSQATPLLTETMKYITVNPTWNVPPSIIRNEYLPALARDPNALARIGLQDRAATATARSASISRRARRNALGRIRFNFPNRFLVYQHDTPDKKLFAQTERAYSHGCMRVQNPDQYAEVLLAIDAAGGALHRRAHPHDVRHGERTINFKTPIPVHITYQTAFVDDGGKSADARRHLRPRPGDREPDERRSRRSQGLGCAGGPQRSAGGPAGLGADPQPGARRGGAASQHEHVRLRFLRTAAHALLLSARSVLDVTAPPVGFATSGWRGRPARWPRSQPRTARSRAHTCAACRTCCRR